jgi:hypothetical protein
VRILHHIPFLLAARPVLRLSSLSIGRFLASMLVSLSAINKDTSTLVSSVSLNCSSLLRLESRLSSSLCTTDGSECHCGSKLSNGLGTISPNPQDCSYRCNGTLSRPTSDCLTDVRSLITIVLLPQGTHLNSAVVSTDFRSTAFNNPEPVPTTTRILLPPLLLRQARNSSSVISQFALLLPLSLSSIKLSQIFLLFSMVGNTYPYTYNDWFEDISLAYNSGADGFALNLGTDDWQLKQFVFS